MQVTIEHTELLLYVFSGIYSRSYKKPNSYTIKLDLICLLLEVVRCYVSKTILYGLWDKANVFGLAGFLLKR